MKRRLKGPLGSESIALTAGASGSLSVAAATELRENLKRFGAAYGDYIKRTRRFIPIVL